MGCKHGICRAPNMCACEVGWEGNNCEICVRLPGCENGNCTNEFECNCHDGWSGACSNVRKYFQFIRLSVFSGKESWHPFIKDFTSTKADVGDTPYQASQLISN